MDVVMMASGWQRQGATAIGIAAVGFCAGHAAGRWRSARTPADALVADRVLVAHDAGSPSGEVQIGATIPRWNTQEDQEKGDSYTVYSVLVNALGRGNWTIQRRYKDFCELHDKLGAAGARGLPLLPRKKMMGNMAKAVEAERREELEQYLQKLCRLSMHAAKQQADGKVPVSMRPLLTFVGAEWLLEEEDTTPPPRNPPGQLHETPADVAAATKEGPNRAEKQTKADQKQAAADKKQQAKQVKADKKQREKDAEERAKQHEQSAKEVLAKAGVQDSAPMASGRASMKAKQWAEAVAHFTGALAGVQQGVQGPAPAAGTSSSGSDGGGVPAESTAWKCFLNDMLVTPSHCRAVERWVKRKNSHEKTLTLPKGIQLSLSLRDIKIACVCANSSGMHDRY